MTERAHAITVLPDRLSVARLEAGAEVPRPPAGTALWCAARTADELSVVTTEGAEPPGAAVETGFRCLGVRGPLAFAEVGVLASLSGVLAAAGVSLFAISTYDTDYLLVKETDLVRAVEALRDAGHHVEGLA